MTPLDAIALHNAAYASRDAGALLDALAPGCLYEMPLLRSRMVGRAEIAEGLRLAFAATSRCALEITRERHSGAAALVEGVMTAELVREKTTAALPFAMVAESGQGGITRMSLYLDARPFRLWADGPVMAMAG
jgi:hypothetical protein